VFLFFGALTMGQSKAHQGIRPASLQQRVTIHHSSGLLLLALLLRGYHDCTARCDSGVPTKHFATNSPCNKAPSFLIP